MANEPCPMERFCKILGSKWGCAVLRSLLKNEEVSFNDLRRILEANPKTLSTKLKLLEKNGLVKRRVMGEERPIRVFYSLSNRGREVRRVDEFISSWLKETERR